MNWGNRQTTKSYMVVPDFWGDNHYYADTVHEEVNYSKLLGPNGQPLVYEKRPIGFLR